MEDQGLNTGRGFRTHEYMLAVSDRQRQVPLSLPRQNEASDDKRPGMTAGGHLHPYAALQATGCRAPKAVLPVNPRRPAAGMDLTVGPLSANSPSLST